MRIPPNGFRPVGQASSTALNRENEISKQKFSDQFESGKKITKSGQVAACDIIDEVKNLALSFKSGSITKEEASKQFVSLVLEKRHDLGSFGPNGKKIEEAVQEFAGDDPQFVSSLVRQLQKLA